MREEDFAVRIPFQQPGDSNLLVVFEWPTGGIQFYTEENERRNLAGKHIRFQAIEKQKTKDGISDAVFSFSTKTTKPG